MSEQTARACPFCGSTLLSACTVAAWWHKCDDCGTEGPSGRTQAEALARWNTRTGDAELVPLRRLREALDSALQVEDGEWVETVYVNPPKWCAVMDALTASKQASAPTGDEHK